MVCPIVAATSDYVFCNVILTGGGSNMEITVSYGDSLSNDVFTPLGKTQMEISFLK
jgi:hypothetical protein